MATSPMMTRCKDEANIPPTTSLFKKYRSSLCAMAAGGVVVTIVAAATLSAYKKQDLREDAYKKAQATTVQMASTLGGVGKVHIQTLKDGRRVCSVLRGINRYDEMVIETSLCDNKGNPTRIERITFVPTAEHPSGPN